MDAPCRARLNGSSHNMAKKKFPLTHTCPAHGGVSKGHFKTCPEAKRLGYNKSGAKGSKQVKGPKPGKR